MIHYLQDIKFSGRFASPDNMGTVSVSDVLYNYENNIISDCTLQKKNAYMQFEPLRRYIESVKSENV